MNFRFVLNTNELFIHSGEDKKNKYKYQVLNAKLRTTHVRIASSVKLEIEKVLSSTDAKYHFRAPLVRIWSIPRHAVDYEATNVFLNSKVPSLLICGLVLTSSVHGDFCKFVGKTDRQTDRLTKVEKTKNTIIFIFCEIFKLRFFGFFFF